MLRPVDVVSRFCTVALFLLVVSAVPAHAQRGRGGTPAFPPEVLKEQQEEMDFNTLNATPDPDKKIKLITQFLSNYPDSKRKQLVDNMLIDVYYARQDWTNFYSTAEKTIAAYPEDVDILTLVGWVIPHSYNPSDPDAARKLELAESYEKHAIEVIPTMQKPATVVDEQFAAAKASKLAQAHSGLGLVYNRKRDWDNSVKELQLATQGNDVPDQTDLYALAYGLERLSRYAEAADAYDRCSMAPGILQDRCKQSADSARTQSLQLK